MCFVELLLEDVRSLEKNQGRVLLISNDRAWYSALKGALGGIASVQRMDPSGAPGSLYAGEYDLVIVDISFAEPTEKETRELVKHIRRQLPSSRIILASDSPTWQRARASFRIGAQDYISKSDDKSKLLTDLKAHLKAKGIPFD